MSEVWLPTLQTPDPQSGYDLAVKLSRVAVKLAQTDSAVREKLRAVYEIEADSLIDVSGAVATHFQTIAAANDYWRGEK